MTAKLATKLQKIANKRDGAINTLRDQWVESLCEEMEHHLYLRIQTGYYGFDRDVPLGGLGKATQVIITEGQNE